VRCLFFENCIAIVARTVRAAIVTNEAGKHDTVLFERGFVIAAALPNYKLQI
jgi:hypothetical protein